MNKLGRTSKSRLSACHPLLQSIVEESNNIMELSVLCGARSKDAQNEAFRKGNSKVRWPNSKHNVTEGKPFSMAVDVIPYFVEGKSHYDWEDYLAFARLAGVMMAVAYKKGVTLRWGGDWDRDGRSKDQSFYDLPHFELVL